MSAFVRNQDAETRFPLEQEEQTAFLQVAQRQAPFNALNGNLQTVHFRSPKLIARDSFCVKNSSVEGVGPASKFAVRATRSNSDMIAGLQSEQTRSPFEPFQPSAGRYGRSTLQFEQTFLEQL
jgi:hypothetical protein